MKEWLLDMFLVFVVWENNGCSGKDHNILFFKHHGFWNPRIGSFGFGLTPQKSETPCKIEIEIELKGRKRGCLRFQV